MSSRTIASRTLTVQVLLVSLLALAACHDDDNSSGAPPAPIRHEFVTMLDGAQVVPAPLTGTRVRVTVTNLAPDNGTFQSPVWVAFHDGSFDTFDPGSPASIVFERLAEDGTIAPLADAFDASDAGITQGQLHGVLGPDPGPIAPGETVSKVFELDPFEASSRFFSFATQLLPSNDAFLANADPHSHPVFDVAGNFIALDFVLAGGAVLDAGTELNDEVPANTAFFGQTTANSGVPEGGVVATHPGYRAPGTGGVLDRPAFANANFKAPGYRCLAFTFKQLPPREPAAGLATVKLTPGDNQCEFDIQAAGLSGKVTGVMFHEADVGVTGPVLLDCTDTIELDVDGHVRARGTLVVPPGLVGALRSGRAYVNVRTALNPDGECRGQVLTSESFRCPLELDQEIPAPVIGKKVRVTVTNLAPRLGTFCSPVWVGFHDGSFDTHDIGAPFNQFLLTGALERMAEDGRMDPIRTDFSEQDFGKIQGGIVGILGPQNGPIAPGETVSATFRVDTVAASSHFMSYVAKILPSNDCFVANAEPMAHAMFDVGGNFVATDFIVPGLAALDAGTEVNDELPINTAFFGQTTDDTGRLEVANVTLHGGFLPPGSDGILDAPMFAAADFKVVGYRFLSFRFREEPPGPPARGLATCTLVDGGTRLVFTVMANNLSGDATAMHFHEGESGVAGPPLISIMDTVRFNADGRVIASGTKVVDSTFVESIRAGKVYLNVHTDLNPGGECRGQVILDD